MHISGIAGGLRELGHEVHFISPIGSGPAIAPNDRTRSGVLARTSHFMADRLPQILFELMEIAYNAVALIRLRVGVMRINPDVIYERYAFFCLAGVMTARDIGIPIVIEVNELAGFERVRRQRLWPLARKIEGFIFKRADLILTVSSFLREKIIAQGVHPDKVHIVPNAVDKTKFTCVSDSAELRAAYNPAGRLVIGFVGYLIHWHKFDVLLQAFEMVRRQYKNILLIFVGDGPLKSYVLKSAESLGIEDSVVVTGNVSHDEIPRYISMFDIAVIPHSNDYRSPIKMFEYMAVGKPVIAPDMEPIGVVIKDGVTGLLFNPGNHSSLSEAILVLIQSEQLRREIGQRGRELVFEKYTWDKHARRIVDLIGAQSNGNYHVFNDKRLSSVVSANPPPSTKTTASSRH